jgi:hypothetical protein
METRSGKKYEYTLIHKKKVYKCSFCNQVGHKINNCNNKDIEVLYKKCIEAFVFSTNIFNNNFFIYMWLYYLKQSERTVLTYKIFNCNKPINNKFSILTNKLLENESDNLDFIETFNEIDDETIKFYIELINIEFSEKHMRELYINKITLYKSSQKKFNIETEIILEDINKNNECPICLDNTNISNKLIKTDCNHNYCDKCLKKYLYSLNNSININPCCACCRTSIKKLYFQDEEILNLYRKKYIIENN